jgi:hypothetical protein
LFLKSSSLLYLCRTTYLSIIHMSLNTSFRNPSKAFFSELLCTKLLQLLFLSLW